MTDYSGTEYDHSGHGEIKARELDTRVHDGVTMLRCERCHVMARPDEADEVFDNHDCDRYKDLQENITGNL